MKPTTRKLTRKEKVARRQAEIQTAQRNWRRSMMLSVIVLVGSFFFLRPLVGWAYLDFDPAFWIALRWFILPTLLGSAVYYIKFWPKLNIQHRIWEVILGIVLVALFFSIVLGSTSLIYINAGKVIASEWVSGVIIQKHVRDYGRRTIFVPRLTMRTSEPETLGFNVSWDVFRATNEGDTLTVQMHTGRFGWKFARYFEAKDTAILTREEILDWLQ